ncbi:TPA: hypothetical protein DEP34_00395 [Candidatus Uhrbacteria bacterium]|nr:hypothetical protein [Candidatus Uhrbacteria bacterium]HCB18832.1 hypothetical protein [Candidatus Uhrbacteria bacterium]
MPIFWYFLLFANEESLRPKGFLCAHDSLFRVQTKVLFLFQTHGEHRTMAFQALFLRFLVHATYDVFKWLDTRFAVWLSRRHWFWLLAILGIVVALDLAIATGAAIPVLGTILSSADGALLLVDEALMIWPVARVGLELLRRAKVVMIAKGVRVPASLEKIEAVMADRAQETCERAERSARVALISQGAQTK